MKKSRTNGIIRFGAALLCTVVCMGTTSTMLAFADSTKVNEYEEITCTYDEYSSGITRAADRPTKFYNITAKGPYKATLLDLRSNTGTNTLYYFTTSTGSFTLEYDLKESGDTGENIDRYIEFQLYERVSLTDDWELLDTQEACIWGVHSGTITFDGLNENNSYFFRFYNSTGYSQYSKMNISGTVTIDE